MRFLNLGTQVRPSKETERERQIWLIGVDVGKSRMTLLISKIALKWTQFSNLYPSAYFSPSFRNLSIGIKFGKGIQLYNRDLYPIIHEL